MKNIFFLLLSVITMSMFTSCEKDEPTLKSETIVRECDTFKYEVITQSTWTTITITDSLRNHTQYKLTTPQTWVYEWTLEKPYEFGYVNTFIKGADNKATETTDSTITVRIYKNGELIEEGIGTFPMISYKFE